jgi:hypothetical protein
LSLDIGAVARIVTKAKLVEEEAYSLYSQHILLLTIVSVLNALVLMLFRYGVLPKLALEGSKA